MSNLKIRQKFFILGVISIASLLFLGWLALKINKDSFTNSNNAVINFKESQDIQTLYIEDLFILREVVLSLVISPNDEYKKTVDKKINPIIVKLDKSFTNNHLEMKGIWEEYKNLVLKTREFSLQSFDEGAFMNTSTEERDKFYILINKLKHIQEEKLENSKNKLEELKKNVTLNSYYIILAVIIIGILILVLDRIVIVSMIKKIESVQIGLRNFFDYLNDPMDYKKQLHIEVKSNDELGLMSNAINKKVKAIKENLEYDYKLIQEATIAVEHLKQGKFGNSLRKEAKSKELNALKDVMNEMIIDLEKKIQEEISQRTDQEKLMLQQSKLAAMGEMIGNIAHQWRQPISEINATLMELETITRYNTLEKEHLLESIALCNSITEHMSTTISDFQNFFKPTKEKDEFSVSKACKKAISIINASLKNNNIKLILNINKDNNIIGYSNEFSHAILNILSNAKDVLVSRKIEDPKIFLTIKVGKNYTLINIEDNARGIEINPIDSIFEPYFTTKHAKQGTGIGLYMTKLIIENNMQGFVNVKNSDKGALFTIKVK